jgi:hypothetical protein
LLQAFLKVPGTPGEAMRPGRYSLRDGPRTTTTLAWVARSVPQGDFKISWGLGPVIHPGVSPPYRVTVTEALLVIEAAV